MPMKTRQRRNKCLFCGKPARERFHIDLHDGKPHIPIHACGHDHLEHMRQRMKYFEVKHGG